MDLSRGFAKTCYRLSSSLGVYYLIAAWVVSVVDAVQPWNPDKCFRNLPCIPLP
jgi:hypothetical protein